MNVFHVTSYGIFENGRKITTSVPHGLSVGEVVEIDFLYPHWTRFFPTLRRLARRFLRIGVSRVMITKVTGTTFTVNAK